MKNELRCFIFLIVFSIACKDKPIPKPLGNSDDLIGKWASIDSTLTQRLNEFVYIKDTLTFSKNITNNLGTFPYSMSMLGNGAKASGFLSFEYFTIDSISFKYLGPAKIGILNNNFKNRVTFNDDKDTLILDDFRKTYPFSKFYKFYKIK